MMILVGLGLVANAFAVEPIEGTWVTESQEKVAIEPCGSDFCMKVQTGKYAGKEVGKVNGQDYYYTGTVTDPADGKAYDGTAEIKGDMMVLKGCVLMLICKAQTWQHR